MEHVYIIWQQDHPNSRGWGYSDDKSVHKVFGSKDEAEKYLEYANEELAWHAHENGDQEPLFIYSLTEHRFG